jgi:hypothetical protein
MLVKNRHKGKHIETGRGSLDDWEEGALHGQLRGWPPGQNVRELPATAREESGTSKGDVSCSRGEVT